MILNKLAEPDKCPSCKLKLRDECGGVEGCKPRPVCLRFNQHLVIPLLLLPVILLLLGIFRLVARPDRDELLFKSSEAFKENPGLEEFEDRELINGLKTSFVPLITNSFPLNVLPLHHQRQRRQLKEIVWDQYDMGNMSNVDTIVWAAVKPPIRNTSRMLDNSDQRNKKRGSNKQDEKNVQDDEQETFEIKATNSLVEEKKKSRRSFWDGKIDQKSIRKAQAKIMLSLMNISVDPCMDFYEYACGGWANTHPIPKNRAGSGTIEILKSNIDEVVRRLLENDLDASDEKNIVDDINVNNNRNIKATSSDEFKKIGKSESLSFGETQTVVKPNHMLQNLEHSTIPHETNNERMKTPTIFFKTADSMSKLSSEDNGQIQLSKLPKLLVSLLDKQTFNKEALLSKGSTNEGKRNFSDEYNNSTINLDSAVSLKQNNSTIVDFHISMFQDKVEDENNAERDLAENISPERHFGQDNPAKIINTSSSDRVRIFLNNQDTSSTELKSISTPLSSSQQQDDRTKLGHGIDVINLHLMRESSNLERIPTAGKSAKEESDNAVSFEQSKNQERQYDATRKAKNFYKSCMNMDVIERRAEKPLVKLLEELGGGWPKQVARSDTPFEWTTLAAKLRLYNNNILIAEWVGPDIHNSTEYVVQLDEAGLGLPTRDYFLSSSNTESVKAYRQFIVTVANLLGATSKDAEKLADQLVNFEIHLALITASHEEKKNLSELYHRMTVSELSEAIPGINWRQYLSIVLESTNPNFNMSSLNSTPVLVFALRYFRDLASLLDKYPPRVIQSYMLWRFASHRAGNLDPRFWAARSQLRKTLTGREEAPPRWESCVGHTTAAVGHAVGSLFVKQHFDEQSKSDTLRMTTEIQAAFRQSILDPNGATASWMDVETRSLAVEKADAMALRVGYPDSILDPNLLDFRYADLKVDPELYFENTLAVLKYLTCREHLMLGTPVDKSQWSAPPTEVNAFYSRNKNQIFLPAGILQPPFYHRHFPRSLNYGGVGVVIGHEMTHGFDDRGRLFDRHGNLQRWWQPTAIEAFQQRAKCLIDQYKQYYVEEVSMQIDGIRTQSENIADNGGLKQAYKAYEDWLTRRRNVNSDEFEETLPDLNASPRQLFFLNFAQVWCGALRPEAIRNKLKTSIHSLEKFRVIGTLSNSEEFAEAFLCPVGSPMNPQVKCSVW